MALVGNPKAKLIYKDLPKDDPKQRKPHIEKAQKILGWEPKVPNPEFSALFQYAAFVA